MSQKRELTRLAKIQDRENRIKDIEAELQCMESCLGQGFTLSDYIDSQKSLVEILKSLNE